MFTKNKISVYIYDDTILIKNHNGKEKKFPRCGITDVEMFVLDMAKKGELNELV
ncbi:hypothetical protein NsoK4_06455 [Nitrosopumilus sp. K4]|uniref:hypothetical protein n=1 Tax=Nitrosopumilus sp. K4 TaxID=2795383 RepID=UPI001BA838F5|nr:hypothetical protein [Nitrosopumilus sp. K4]QUC64086.1 hypothetical protein NsoK4_06455 [Nitrosopumilus sp. K4]